MAHEFEISREVEVEASPDQAWEAIATGRGRDSWFMGRNEIEPGQGGRVGFSVGDFSAEARVRPGSSRSDLYRPAKRRRNGTFHQFECHIKNAPEVAAVSATSTPRC